MNRKHMKSHIKPGTRRGVALVLLAICACLSLRAQTANVTGKLRMDDLDRLASKASDVVNVRMDERLLRLATPMLARGNANDDPEEAAIKDLIKGVRGIYVKNLGFETEGAYTAKDVAFIREQLRAPGWSQIVEVRSRRENVNVEVYLLLNSDRVDGLAVLSFEPKELTVINIVGDVDLDKLARLQGQFGVPELELERAEKPAAPARKKPQQP